VIPRPPRMRSFATRVSATDEKDSEFPCMTASERLGWEEANYLIPEDKARAKTPCDDCRYWFALAADCGHDLTRLRR
jgi:hypothetical protein